MLNFIKEKKRARERKRMNIKIGDIFCIKMDDGSLRFMQYVADDKTEMSPVIRIFKKVYPSDYQFQTEEIVADEVDFYSMTWCLSHGIQDGDWQRVGWSNNVGDTENIMFRFYHDAFNFVNKKKSYQWYVWKINHERIDIGELTDEYKKRADWGLIFSTVQLLEKI